MSFVTAQGSFAAITAGGPGQSVAGLGGTPKAVFVWTNARVAVGASANGDTIRHSEGMASGATARIAQAITVQEGPGGDASFQHGWSESSVIYLLNHDGTVYAQGDIVLDADGFTINWSALPAAAIRIYWLALGAGLCANAKVGAFQANTSGNNPATQNVSGVGFQADLVLFRCSAMTGEGVGAPSSADVRSFGAATGPGSMWSMPPHGAIDTADCLFTLATKHAALASMGPDGWALTWQPAGTQPYRIGYLALQGLLAAVGTDTQPAANGTQAKGGLGLTPAALKLIGPTGQTIVAASLTRGHASGAGQSSMTLASKSVNPLRATSDAETSSLLAMLNNTGGAFSILGIGALHSLDVGGYTLDWTNCDGTVRTFAYVALAPSAAAPTNITPPTIQGPLSLDSTVLATGDAWANTPTSYTRQWYRNGVAIPAATGQTYRFVSADVGQNITVGVKAINAAGTSAEALSSAVVPVALILGPVKWLGAFAQMNRFMPGSQRFRP